KKRSFMLTVQYRMHEDIMSFPSRYFYGDRLSAHESVRNHTLPASTQPVEFIDTAGCGFEEIQDPETLSRSNPEEAHLVIRVVEDLINEIGTERWTESGFTMAVITPYRSQVDELKKLEEASSVVESVRKKISIDTVDAFQGQERDIIVISFVRSNNN